MPFWNLSKKTSHKIFPFSTSGYNEKYPKMKKRKAIITTFF